MSFFAELKRRNVFRMAVAYLAVAWLLIEVTGTLLPAFGVPDWVFRFVIIALAIGFVPAIIVSWIFELTPEGFKREAEVEPARSIARTTGQRLNVLTITVLMLAIGVLALDRFWLAQRQPEPLGTVDTKQVEVKDAAATGLPDSIAVLPFANRSDKPEDRFFVDGIHDDLLTFISQIGSLKTISRTSVMRYRESSQTIPEIAGELGVSAVLEGGVQRAGDSVRINVQLIDARTDTHLWSRIFDRELTASNIFAIQSEIAGEIAGALRAELTPEESERINTVPTQNLDALERYFQGRQALVTRTTNGLEAAKRHFSAAVELDQKFALAWVGLADASRLYPFYAVLSDEQWDQELDRARTAVATALAIDPLLGEAHATSATLMGRWDIEGVEAAFRKAARLNPNYAATYQWHGERLGFWLIRLDEAQALLLKAMSLDPLSAIIVNDYGEVLNAAGQYDAALQAFERAVTLEPEFAVGYRRIGDLHARAFRRLDRALTAHRKSLELEPTRWGTANYIGQLYLQMDDVEQASEWLNRTETLLPNGVLPDLALELLVYQGASDAAAAQAETMLELGARSDLALLVLTDHELRAGRPEAALPWFERMRPDWFTGDPAEVRGSADEVISLAMVLEATGDADGAERMLSRAAALIAGNNRLNYAGFAIADVRLHAIRGQMEQALAALQNAYDEGWSFQAWYWLRHDLALEPLRNEPAFQAIRQRIESELTTQRASLVALQMHTGTPD